MRILIFIISSVILGSNFAQDQIILVTGDTVQAKISEIKEGVINYKVFNYPDGPNIELATQKISKIIFPNGQELFFNKKSNTTNKEESHESNTVFYDHKRNGFEIITTDLVKAKFSFAYRRLLGDYTEFVIRGSIIGIPKSSTNFIEENTKSRNYNPQVNNRYLISFADYFGLQFLYHPAKALRFDPYIGVGIKFGYNIVYNNLYTYYDQGGIGYQTYNTTTKWELAYAPAINYGARIHFTQNFGLNISIANGIIIEDGYGFVMPTVRAGIGLVYKF